ncbi:MAG: hypothetical protein LBU45_09230 [Azoarcus sp.]|nr:hypothetical protein [Azoarcus sp.]
MGLGGNDTLYGGAGNDRLEGGEANDELNSDVGDDILLGKQVTTLIEKLCGGLIARRGGENRAGAGRGRTTRRSSSPRRR